MPQLETMTITTSISNGSVTADLGESLIVLGEYPLVVLPLHLAHFHSQDLFHLRRQRPFHVLLHATQQEWLQLGVQLPKPGPVGRLVFLFKRLPVTKPTRHTHTHTSDLPTSNSSLSMVVVISAHLPTEHSLFHAHLPLSATEVLQLQDCVCGTVYQQSTIRQITSYGQFRQHLKARLFGA